MTGQLFAVINTRGPNWDDAKPMEEQIDWRDHADFMNGLAAEGFVLLGGPFKGTRDVLLIVRAGRTRRPAAQRAKEQLLRVGANLLGVILTDAKLDRGVYRY